MPSLGSFAELLVMMYHQIHSENLPQISFYIVTPVPSIAIPEPDQIDTCYEKIKYFSSIMYSEHVVLSSLPV